MVFKPFTTLARQSISKHLVNHTQSLVAASQSSYASSTLPINRIGQNQAAPAKFQNAFGGAHSGRAAPGKDGSGNDVLSAFYAANASLDDNEDKKYLFSKKILWSKAQHQQQHKQLLGAGPEPIAEPLPARLAEAAEEGDVELKDGESAAQVAVDAQAAEEVLAKDNASEQVALAEALESETSSATAQFNTELQLMCEHGLDEECIALFRHMAEKGIQMNTTSYNLYLSSIIKLRPRYTSQVIDVYQSMLREKLIPNTATYGILIQFLALRALQAQEIASNIDRDANRFDILLESKSRDVEEMKAEESLDYALGLFYDSTEIRTERTFPLYIYDVLVEACSKHNRHDDMLKVVEHMEKHNIEPTSEIIRSMIRGFGRSGDVRSAVETYNGYQELKVAHDPANMEQRYQVYRDLIKAYFDAGDETGALTFLEKVADISHESARLEGLKQAVIEGFVDQGDIQAAKTWTTSHLAIECVSNEWFARLVTRVADHGDLDFTRQLYNTLKLDHMSSIQRETGYQIAKHRLAECQMAGLALCITKGEVDEARTLWKDLCSSEISAGPLITAALAYTSMLFEKGFNNEALVVLNQFGGFLLERSLPSPAKVPDHNLTVDARIALLREGYEVIITSLSDKGLLTPSIALDISGFSIDRCGGLGVEASRRVLGLFEETRLMGLTPEQLSLVLQLQYKMVQAVVGKGEALWPEDHKNFEFMFHLALKAGFPIIGASAEALERGSAMFAQINPGLLAAWNHYVQQQLMRHASPVPITPVQGLSPMSPTLVASEGETATLADDSIDPYWAKTDVKNSNMIDSTIDRKYVKISDIRRMYRNTRRSGRTLRLTTLARIIAAASRSPKRHEIAMHEEFVDEIIRNAKIDCPYMPEYNVSRFGWCSLLDAMVAAQLNFQHRDKAALFHGEMLQIGASPSANTYGLYITSLKNTYQTYDEATEAVNIFNRAISENVLPTPFLYNAVIGKLAKARRVDDCLSYFATMRASGIKPTSVTYGTMINALVRVGDQSFAEELFEEMEIQSNYKPRAAPYNSLIQFYTTTKRDRAKVLAYYNRMLSVGITPTGHTYKLLIEAYATLDQPDMVAAENVLESIKASGLPIETSHHAALIHAKGCVLHDVPAAVKHFEDVIAGGMPPDSTLYQALLECLVANHRVAETSRWVEDMAQKNIMMTPYIANSLIHGWALEKNIEKAKEVYDKLGTQPGTVKREPSTYEVMTRAYLAVEDRIGARMVADEMMGRGYPNAVVARVLDLVRGAEI